MFTARTAAAAGGLLIATLLAAPASATPDTNCADYPTREAAQAAFEANGGSPTYNWHGLDNDHDGQVCEHHQFPGQPTPPPNPGPSGCAVCTPTPSPSPSSEPVPSEPPSVGEPPAAGEPQLPVTGVDAPVIAGWGLGIAFLGIGLVGMARGRRRRTQ